MLNRTLLTLAVAGIVAMGALAGCSDKTKAERDALSAENKALQDKLTAEQSAREAAERERAAMLNQINTTPVAPTTPVTPTTPIVTEPTVPAVTNEGDGVSESKNKSGENQIEVSGDVLFDSGKATLKPAAKKSLDKVSAIIKSKYKGKELRIEGHTDSVPVKRTGWDDNWDLGAARARTVALYLIANGVPKSSLYIASFADNEPKSKTNLAQNRRVSVVVVGK